MKNKKIIVSMFALTILLSAVPAKGTFHDEILRSGGAILRTGSVATRNVSELVYRGALLVCALNVVRQGTCWLGSFLGFRPFLQYLGLCSREVPKDMDGIRNMVVEHNTQLDSLEDTVNKLRTSVNHRIRGKEFGLLAERVSALEALDLVSSQVQIKSALKHLTSDVNGLNNALQEQVSQHSTLAGRFTAIEQKKSMKGRLKNAFKRRVDSTGASSSQQPLIDVIPADQSAGEYKENE